MILDAQRPPARWSGWTVSLGLQESVEGYRDVLKANGCKIGPWGDVLLRKIWLMPGIRTRNVYALSARDLGFSEPPTYYELARRAFLYGFTHGEPEIYPALRLHVLTTSFPERRVGVGIQGLSYRTPLLVGCVVDDFEGRWLDGGGHPEFRFNLDLPFAFVRS